LTGRFIYVKVSDLRFLTAYSNKGNALEFVSKPRKEVNIDNCIL